MAGLWSTLRGRWSSWPTRPALRAESGAELTYAELDTAVAGAARRLSAAGVTAGRTVAVAVPSRPDLVITVLAALHCGARVVLANIRWWPRDLRAVVEAAEPGLVVTTASSAPTLADLASLAVLADESGRPAWADPDGVDLPRWRPCPKPAAGAGVGPAAGAEAAGTLVGHSTGAWREPRPVAIPEAELVRRWCGAGPAGGPGSTTLVACEVGAVTALAVVVAALAGGGRVALTEHDAPGRLVRRLARGGVDRLWASGPQLNQLAARLPPGTRLPPLAGIEAAAGALHPPAAARLAEAFGSEGGAAIGASLTLTELAGAATSRAPGPSAAHRALDLGRPLPEARLVLARSDGRPVVGGEVGEVLIEPLPGGPGGRAAGSASTPVATGDLARWGDGRTLLFRGRARERFDCGDATVWPVLVEAALGRHPGLVDVAVVPRPHPELGMIPVAVTVPLDPEAPPFLTDLAPLLDGLPPAWRPRAQAVVERLPLTASGQLHRRMLAYDEVAR